MSALFCALCVCMSGCAERPDTLLKNDAASQPDAPASTMQPDAQASAPPEREIISRVTLLAVGDNLIHDVIYKQAQARTADGSYDFKPVYERVKKQITAADIAMINQETPIVKDRAPSSYPRFNTPPEMTANLRDIGFDVLNIANNHMIDQGANGLAATAEQIRATKGLTVMGVYETPEQRDETAIIEKNDIKFAFLGFTQHTNGLALPKDRQHMAVYTDDATEMRRQIERAHEKADVVAVSVHWGEENTGKPTDYQRQVARDLAEYGADIIIGTHPHVLQPVEIMENSQGKKVPVLYSLGNFVSAQSQSPNMVGAMAEVAVEKNQTTSKVTVGRPQITPIVTHYGAGMWDVSIYPLAEYTEELASSHGVRLSYGKMFDRALIDATIGNVIAPEFIISEVREAIAATGSPEQESKASSQKQAAASSGVNAPAASSDTLKEPAQSVSASDGDAPLGSRENSLAIEPVDPDTSSSAAQDKSSSAAKKSGVSSNKSAASSEEGRLLPKRSDNAA